MAIELNVRLVAPAALIASALFLGADQGIAQKSMTGRTSADVGLLDRGVARYTNKTGGRICDFTVELLNRPGTKITSIEIQNIGEATNPAEQGAPAPGPAASEYNNPGPAGGGAPSQSDFDGDDNGNGALANNEGDDTPPGNRADTTVRVIDRANECIESDADFQIRFVLGRRAADRSQVRITPSADLATNPGGQVVGPGDDLVSAESTGGGTLVAGPLVGWALGALGVAVLSLPVSTWALIRVSGQLAGETHRDVSDSV